jgi:hypothetical protein
MEYAELLVRRPRGPWAVYKNVFVFDAFGLSPKKRTTEMFPCIVEFPTNLPQMRGCLEVCKCTMDLPPYINVSICTGIPSKSNVGQESCTYHGLELCPASCLRRILRILAASLIPKWSAICSSCPTAQSRAAAGRCRVQATT